ncbi:platelet-activating factor acetylhydrolase [Xylaria sp. CBS 124048]|nr:platelet-activating factor acetylhydrolase [Xylaria sp. CBS 124048]
MLSTFISLALVLGVRASANVHVPALTGPHKVGTTVLELIDSSRQDPFAPTPQPRDLVVSLFYPTNLESSGYRTNCTLAHQFSPGAAAGFDAELNATGVVESIITRSCLDAPLSRPDLPLVFLDHGLGTTRLIHSDMAEELASYGWNVVTVDHPYDSTIIEYPDGRLVIASESPNVGNATLEDFLYVRVKDIRFILDSLADPSITSRIPGMGGNSNSYKTSPTKFRTDKVGVYGHSAGGTTALQLLHDDKRFQVGANLDGQVFGSVLHEGVDSPFVFIGRPDHNSKTDETWTEALKNVRGFKREYTVNGTTHGSFTDLSIFRDLLGPNFLTPLIGDLGPIKGARILSIETAFMGALFDRFLKGKGGRLLDGKGLDRWPEVALLQQ